MLEMKTQIPVNYKIIIILVREGRGKREQQQGGG
jgi:hypothetical protein